MPRYHCSRKKKSYQWILKLWQIYSYLIGKIFWIPKIDIMLTLLVLYHISRRNDFFSKFPSHTGIFSYYASFLKISSRFRKYLGNYNQKSIFAVFMFATLAAGIYEHVRFPMIIILSCKSEDTRILIWTQWWH
mgnify:CR=1 FL=1